MSLPGSAAGASGPAAADRMQSQAFILAGRLPLTSAALPKSGGCIGSDLRRLETFRAEPGRSGADEAFIDPPGRREEDAPEPAHPAALDHRFTCVWLRRQTRLTNTSHAHHGVSPRQPGGRG